MMDEEFLALVREQRRSAIGFEQDQELRDDRERALNYYKGEMPDVGALPNRSKAVSTDIADAVETVLPDLVEIFTGGDDVAAFTPQGPQDEDAAQQETDYINHVVFQENNGFLTLYSMFKDALIEKIGVVKFWWQDGAWSEEERFEGKTAAEMALASQDGEIIDVSPYQPGEVGEGAAMMPKEPLYSFTLRCNHDNSCAKVMAVPPEDFSVAPDTVKLSETTYCAMRSRPRVQDLIADGVDEKIARQLPQYGISQQYATERARDTAGEHLNPIDAQNDDLRVVEVVEHHIRVLNENNDLEIWQIRTGADETILIDKQKVQRIPYAAITPYPVTHRFFGRSLADLLFEIQKIKTALTRMALDSGYFALNQRLEVAMDRATDYTISDLLRNEPGVPIRSRSGDAVRPVSSPGLSFDAFGALEYFSTVAENRTGIVRNAQGLNPDTLHDTAKGAMALMTAAQKRVRLIARLFAETGIKELFLGVHAVIRENATAPKIARLRGKWVPVDPGGWAERNDMTIEVGLGASGRDFEIAALGQVANMMQTIVTEQGDANGPIVTSQNVYNAAKRLFSKLGIKTPELFLTDPSTMPPRPPQPDPKLAELQARTKSDLYKANLDAQLQREKMASDAQIRREQMQGELALKQYQIDKQAQVDAVSSMATMQHRTALPRVDIGGQPG